MKHIAGWFRRNNTIMAQTVDLRRRIQEVWGYTADAIDCYEAVRGYYSELRGMYDDLSEAGDSLREQLHRVARERDDERKLRLEAEDRLLDKYLEVEIAREAEELRDYYLEQLENEEE